MKRKSFIDQKQRGMAVVEMAIVTPLMLFMMFAIMEFGVMLYDKAVITMASREAARIGIVSSNPAIPDSQIIQVATTVATNAVGSGSPSTVVTHLAQDTIGFPLMVSVTYPYQTIVVSMLSQLFGAGAIPSTVTLSASTTMYME